MIKKKQVDYNKSMNEKELRKKIAENLRQMRAKYKISQEKLAEKSGVSQQHIYKIENEKVKPSVEKLLMIANALGVTVNDLIY